MTPDQIRQLLLLASAILGPLAKNTATEADDIGVEFAQALADSPAMLTFISKRALGNPEAIQQLVSKLTTP